MHVLSLSLMIIKSHIKSNQLLTNAVRTKQKASWGPIWNSIHYYNIAVDDSLRKKLIYYFYFTENKQLASTIASASVTLMNFYTPQPCISSPPFSYLTTFHVIDVFFFVPFEGAVITVFLM